MYNYKFRNITCTISFSLLFLLIISSCKKENNKIPADTGCIERKIVLVTDHSGFSINNNNIPIINDLFSTNLIDNSKYRYFYYSNDSVQTYFPPYEKFDEKIIRVREFANGLEILSSEIVFLFKNNSFYIRNGNASNGTTLDTIPNLTIGQIRTLFLNTIEQFDDQRSQYQDSCFSAEFGYFNINVNTNGAAENLVKAWKVTLKNSIYPGQYPIAYYQDNDGKLIYYDNGIRIFR